MRPQVQRAPLGVRMEKVAQDGHVAAAGNDQRHIDCGNRVGFDEQIDCMRTGRQIAGIDDISGRQFVPLTDSELLMCFGECQLVVGQSIGYGLYRWYPPCP